MESLKVKEFRLGSYMDDFRPIDGYDGYYISRDSRVLSLLGREPRLLKQPVNKSGYKRIGIFKGLDKKSFLVHRLVAKAFIPNPRKVNVVNHIDGVKTNNHVDNLEWVTPKENVDHAIRTGLLKSAYNFITIYDIKEKKTIMMNTLARATKFLGINIENLIANFSEINPIWDRYIVKFNDEEMKKLNDPDTYRREGREGKLLYYYDYVKQELHGPYMQRYTVYKTKVDATSIRVMLPKQTDGVYYKAGYIFSYDPISKQDIKKYNRYNHVKEREIFLARAQYIESKRDNKIIKVFDYLKQKEMIFENTKDCSKATGIKTDRFSKFLYALKKRKKGVTFIDNLAMTYDNDIVWEDVGLYKVINAVTGKYARGKLFIDKKTNTIIGQMSDLMFLYGENKITASFLMDFINLKDIKVVKRYLDKRNGYKDIELEFLDDKATKENIIKWLPEIKKIGIVHM